MYPYIENATITDLGFGSGFALWGFRAIASGNGNCCHLTTGFNRAFSMDNAHLRSQHGGVEGKLAMNALKSFCYQLSRMGQRKIVLSQSGTMRLTADELCIVGVLAAAQNENSALCKSHLSWLLGHNNTTLPYHAAITYAIICQNSAIDIEPPNITILKTESVTRDMPTSGDRLMPVRINADVMSRSH